MLKLRYLLYHIFFWVLIMLAFAISEWGYRQTFKEAIGFELLFLPSRLIAVYVNWFVLIPKLLYRSKFTKYMLLLLVLIALTSIANRFFILYWGYPNFFPQWVDTANIDVWELSKILQIALIIISPVAFTTGFKLFSNWYRQRKETEALSRQKTEAELKFLKSQTNPHFLFNSLNSIYGLALKKSDKTPRLILKLSDILSYTLYESNMDRVPLQRELTLIENIIGLEKERYDTRVVITYNISGNKDVVSIPPLILVPFIENAFKHGLRNEINEGWIDIRLIVGDELLEFDIRNSIPSAEEGMMEGGLGLKNITRRLELIYGDLHQLHIDKTKDTFKVSLIIKYR